MGSEIDVVKIKEILVTLSKEDIFEELFSHLKWSRKISGYARQEKFSGRLNEFNKESIELQEAFNSGDFDHVAEEIGDVLWDLLFLFVLLEEKGYSTEEIIKSRIQKQVRRLPHVYEGKIVSCDEEFELFKERKKLEKEGKLSGFGLE